MWNGGSFSHRLNRISAVMRLGKGICIRLPGFNRRCFQCETEIRKEPSSLIRGRKLLCSAH